MFDLIVKNGLVVLPTGTQKVDIAVFGGKIVVIGVAGSLNEAKKIVDAEGKYVLPGVVDGHVHFNDPGLTEREDFLTGTSAAAAGGVTTVIEMPLSGNPTVTSVETLNLKKSAAREKAVVDYALWSGLVTDNTSQMELIQSAGAIAFKAFTCFAGDDFPYATSATLYKGMMEAARINALIGVHCEDHDLVEAFEAEARRLGKTSVRDFLDCHSPVTELVATNMVLELAKETGARVHICHASLPEVVALVTEARNSGARVSVETCPHYLLLTEEALEKQQGFLKCTPPVRTLMDLEGLWDLVFSGEIDMIGSDHSPSTLAQKQPASGNFWDAWGGTNGVQTMLPALYSEGVLKRGLPIEQLMRLISTNPAMIFGLYPQKGSIQLGSDADFVIFDPEKEWRVTPDLLFYKNKHTPYMGMTLTGCVEKTFVRGNLVYDSGKIEAKPGSGCFLHR